MQGDIQSAPYRAFLEKTENFTRKRLFTSLLAFPDQPRRGVLLCDPLEHLPPNLVGCEQEDEQGDSDRQEQREETFRGHV